MRKLLALSLALLCAFAPVAWQSIETPKAEAQFQAYQQAKNLQTAATSGNGQTIDVSGNPILTLQTTGLTGGGQVTPEGSIDGAVWVSLTCYPIGSVVGTALIIAAGSQTILRCNTVGLAVARARISTAGGTITVKAFATQSYFPLGTNAP